MCTMTRVRMRCVGAEVTRALALVVVDVMTQGGARRPQVYVGNLVAGLVTEEALRQLFNTTMLVRAAARRNSLPV